MHMFFKEYRELRKKAYNFSTPMEEDRKISIGEYKKTESFPLIYDCVTLKPVIITKKLFLKGFDDIIHEYSIGMGGQDGKWKYEDHTRWMYGFGENFPVKYPFQGFRTNIDTFRFIVVGMYFQNVGEECDTDEFGKYVTGSIEVDECQPDTYNLSKYGKYAYGDIDYVTTYHIRSVERNLDGKHLYLSVRRENVVDVWRTTRGLDFELEKSSMKMLRALEEKYT